MIKTAEDIKQDIRQMLIGSDLANAISGDIYYSYGDDDDRPKDSELEDIVIVVTEGDTADVQAGTFTLVIYVPDVDSYGDGTMRADGARLSELATLAERWRRSLAVTATNYHFPQRQPTILTLAELHPNVHQHFVSVGVRYRYYDE